MPSTTAKAALFLAVFSVLLALAVAFDARRERLAAAERDQMQVRRIIELEKRLQSLEAPGQ